MAEHKPGRLIHLVSCNRWRGSAQYALDICSDLIRSGWETSVYTRDAKAVDSRFQRAGIPLRHAPLAGLLDFPTILALARQLRSGEGRCVVHTHRYRDALTALLARRLSRRDDTRVVLTRHSARPGRDNPLYRHIYSGLDAQIFISATVRERFLSTWKGRALPFPADRLHTLYESIPLLPTAPVPESARGPRIALYAGAIKPGKGLETLIDALLLLKGARTRLRIAGNGDPDYADTLRRRMQARGVDHLIDWVRDPDDIASLTAEAHFGVLPAVEPEPFGLNNLQFMACGRPLVCTDNGGQSEYLTDGVDALLVRPADAEALGQAMLRLATDDPLRHAMGRRAYDTFTRRLSWPAFRESLLKIYTGETPPQPR